MRHGNSCPSLWPLGTIKFGEDCLTLNVYTKSLTGKRPVMVWIFGGGFFLGSGNDIIYGPDYLIDEDVIVVTINYRLAALGFLSTNDNNAPGNYGLKDCILALKWIQNNIAQFGGDPTKVTIFGESAGAAAVHYLILSPIARGLFSRAISQSGSALSPWAFQHDPQTSAYNLAKKLSISFTDNRDLIEKLRNVKTMDILLATPEWMNYVGFLDFINVFSFLFYCVFNLFSPFLEDFYHFHLHRHKIQKMLKHPKDFYQTLH